MKILVGEYLKKGSGGLDNKLAYGAGLIHLAADLNSISSYPLRIAEGCLTSS